MHIESLKTVLMRDIADLQDISAIIEPGYALSKIEVQILQSRVRNLASEINELIEKISAGSIPVNETPAEEKLVQITQTTTPKPKAVEEKRVVDVSAQRSDIVVQPISKAAKSSVNPDPLSTNQQELQDKAVAAKMQAPKADEVPHVVNTEKAVQHVYEEKAVPKPETPANEAPSRKEAPKVITEHRSAKKPEVGSKSVMDSEQVLGRKTLADQFSESAVSVNERVGQAGQTIDRASMLGRKPVADIHKAIKLNDRIGFIRELFGGDSHKYTQAIDALNNFSDFDQALEFINQNFTWDQASDQFRTLIDIVYRRYMN